MIYLKITLGAQVPKVYDAIVIGSGAGGGMYAKVLTEAGASVLLVDAGSHQIDRDIRHHQWRWELPYRDQYQQDQDYTVRLKTTVHEVGRGDSESVTLFDGSAHNTYYNNHFWAKRRDWKYTFPENKPYRWVRVRALGGKTNCWDANTTRWGAIEFQPASYDGYDVDWPITYEEMAPWYSKTERLIGVSGPDTKSEQCPPGEWLPTIGPTCPEAQLARGADRLGLYAFMNPKAAITRDYNGRSKCHYCGPCSHGCDSGSKFTTVGVLLPPSMATGRLTLQLNSIVREIIVGSDGRAKGIAYIDRYGFQEGEAFGRNVVLCASAIETARILLNSKSGSFPQGLANSSGQVGRNLVENVTASVSGYFPDMQNRPVTNEDGWGTGMLIAPFVNVDERTRSKKFLRRYTTGLEGGFGMNGGGARGGELLGRGYKQDVRAWYGTGMGVSSSGEGLQSPHNYIDLDPEVKDAWGIPAARIQMTFGENEQAMVKDMVEQGIKIIEAAGGGVTGWQVSPSIPGGQIHEQGTCRMGNDPKHFVTNRWGQCHDVPNLLLGDGSLHVSCSTENPTLTILALSMRNAEHLAQSVRKHEL
jgi:choline dehydrogenase-like flavoprotein